jgi:hypothetical protein
VQEAQQDEAESEGNSTRTSNQHRQHPTTHQAIKVGSAYSYIFQPATDDTSSSRRPSTQASAYRRRFTCILASEGRLPAHIRCSTRTLTCVAVVQSVLAPIAFIQVYPSDSAFVYTLQASASTTFVQDPFSINKNNKTL